MKDLTLEQVKTARRFAWHEETRAIFADGALWQYPANGPWEPEPLMISAPAMVTVLERGPWHHVPGCVCQYCAEKE